MKTLKTIAVTVLISSFFSVSSIAGKLDKEVSGAQINPQIDQQNPRLKTEKYFDCSCQCGSATHKLPAVKDCSSYNGNRCVSPRPTGATVPTYRNCVKTRKTGS